MKHVLFYDEAPEYGGHQVTAIDAARAVASEYAVSFAFAATNTRMGARLAAIPDIHALPLDLRLQRLQPLLAPLGIGGRAARTLLRRESPDILIAVQGDALQSTRMVEQARREGRAVISFTPFATQFTSPHWLKNSLARLLARYGYRRPSAWITTSETARRNLIESGVRGPIRVVFYGPQTGTAPVADRDRARQRFAIRPGHFAIALIGRIHFSHKGHDVMLRALHRMGPEARDIRLIVAGDGADARRLDELAASLGLEQTIVRTGWLDDPSDVYSAADLVAVPSRFEGLPLVILEAMYRRKRIVAADVGAIHEVLPSLWLFKSEDVGGLIDAIQRVRSDPADSLLEAHRSRIEGEMNLSAFGQGFREAIREFASLR